jgi:hypothetical protein
MDTAAWAIIYASRRRRMPHAACRTRTQKIVDMRLDVRIHRTATFMPGVFTINTHIS